MKLLFENTQRWCLRILPRPKVWIWNMQELQKFSASFLEMQDHPAPGSIILPGVSCFTKPLVKITLFSNPWGKNNHMRKQSYSLTSDCKNPKQRHSVNQNQQQNFLPIFISGSLCVQTWELASYTLALSRAQSNKNSIRVAKFLSD